MSQAPLFAQPIETRFPGVANAEKLQFGILAPRSIPSAPPWLNAFQTNKAPLPRGCHGLHLPRLFCPHDAEITEPQESPPRIPGRCFPPPLSFFSRQAFCLLQSPAPSDAR